MVDLRLLFRSLFHKQQRFRLRPIVALSAITPLGLPSPFQIIAGYCWSSLSFLQAFHERRLATLVGPVGDGCACMVS